VTRHLIDDYGHTTQTVPVDEWSDEFPPDPQPQMSRAELGEAAQRLSEVSDLVGYIPAEIMAGLVSTLQRRDGAAMFWLRLLRSLDEAARS
jgi:hypothetical protein